MIKRISQLTFVCVFCSSLLVNQASAQTAEATFKVNQLEEQVRQLNGRIEDLNFQLLQLQETLRKLQEDNEFRFQELEDRSDAGGSSKRKSIADLINPNSETEGGTGLGKPEPSDNTAIAGNSGGSRLGGKRMIDGVEIYDGDGKLSAAGPQPLGKIIYDNNGNIVDSSLGAPIDLTKRLYGGGDTQVREPIPANADELYSLGYNYIQSGDYALAEEAFRKFIDAFPAHPRLPDAHFWLGESHFARNNYEAAAKVFLTAHKNWPDSRLGAQTLMKLGVSVAGMNQRELACATFAQVGEKYPGASPVVKRNVKQQQKAVRCSVN